MATDLAAKESPIDVMRRTSAFLQEAVDNEVEIAYPTSTTETYTFKDASTTYYVITLTYNDATKAELISAKRTS